MKNSVLGCLLFAFLVGFIGCKKGAEGVKDINPTAPSGLVVTATTLTQVSLAWTDNSSNETGFKIERKTSGSFQEIGSVAAGITSYTDLSVQANSTYIYRVFAYNAVGNSLQPSNEVTATTRSLPVLTSVSITNITNTSATAGGNITSDGGSSITAKGVVWHTSTNPTTALSTKTSDGIGTGIFSSAISGLAANTTYYVRAYATNTYGTSYGNELSFTTSNAKDVYVAGYENYSAIIEKNGTRILTSALGNTFNASTGARSIFVSGSDVYAAGYATGGSETKVVLWKNGTPSYLEVANSYSNGWDPVIYANSVFVSGSNVYVAGTGFYSAKIWKNTIATTLTPTNSSGSANAVYVSGSDVYVVGGNDGEAVIWKNGVMSYLPNQNQGSEAKSVFVSGGNVYVAGYINNVSTGKDMAVVWKNNVVTVLSNSNTVDAVANSVYVSGSDVYVAGSVKLNSGIYEATLWKNGVATVLTNSAIQTGFANAVFVDGTDVYVAGRYVNDQESGYAPKSGPPRRFIWKNGTWLSISSLNGVDKNSNSIFVK
jgi:hypothetical protein